MASLRVRSTCALLLLVLGLGGVSGSIGGDRLGAWWASAFLGLLVTAPALTWLHEIRHQSDRASPSSFDLVSSTEEGSVPLAEPLPRGTRVRVRQDREFGPGPWPDEPLGTVACSWEWVNTVRGRQRTYWVTFDEPQDDADGDGPYVESQVLEQYLEPVAD